MTPNQPDDETVLPCAGKLAFDTKREADGAATFVLHRHGSHVRAYVCRHCGLWHLTGQPE